MSYHPSSVSEVNGWLETDDEVSSEMEWVKLEWKKRVGSYREPFHLTTSSPHLPSFIHSSSHPLTSSAVGGPCGAETRWEDDEWSSEWWRVKGEHWNPRERTGRKGQPRDMRWHPKGWTKGGDSSHLSHLSRLSPCLPSLPSTASSLRTPRSSAPEGGLRRWMEGE